jgi:hypothetical protein
MTKRLLFAVAFCLVAGPAWAGMFLGDYPAGNVIICMYNTNDQTGASITRSTDGTLKIYKGSSATERTSLAGVVQTEDFDAATGVHLILIDTSDNTDAGFWVAGSFYHVVNTGMVIDTKTVNAHLCSFSLEYPGGTVALLKSIITGSAFVRSNALQWASQTIPTPSVTGVPKVDATTWNGTAVATPAAAGIPDVNVKNFASTSQTAGTDVALNSAHLNTSLELNAGNYRFTTAALALAPTGAGGSTGVTLQTAESWVKGSTSIVQEVFIRDSTNGLGKTGLTSGSSGLTIAWSRPDQGNTAASTCAPQTATRGAYVSCGFVEKDSALLPGIYQVGLTTAMLASGSDTVTVGVGGVSGTVMTIVPIGLVSVGLAQLDTKLGTPAGASVSADAAATKAVVDAIKVKTDPITTASGDVLARVNTYTSGQAPLQPAVAGRTAAVAADGSISPNWADVKSPTTSLALTGTTVGTTTNVTNAPTAGDLTTTMKTSVQTAASAATPASVLANGTMRKNVASQEWSIFVTDATGAVCTNKAITLVVSKDSGAFGAVVGGTAPEVGGAGNGRGWYRLLPSQADTNCDVCRYEGTATGGCVGRTQFKTTP